MSQIQENKIKLWCFSNVGHDASFSVITVAYNFMVSSKRISVTTLKNSIGGITRGGFETVSE